MHEIFEKTSILNKSLQMVEIDLIVAVTSVLSTVSSLQNLRNMDHFEKPYLNCISIYKKDNGMKEPKKKTSNRFDIIFINKLKFSIKLRCFVYESKTFSNVELTVEKNMKSFFMKWLIVSFEKWKIDFLKNSYKNSKTLTNIIS